VIGVNGDFKTLTLYNISGSKVMETTESQISTAAFAPGTYITQVSNGKHLQTRKINIR